MNAIKHKKRERLLSVEEELRVRLSKTRPRIKLAGMLPIYDRTIATSQSLQYDFYWTKMRPEINNRPIIWRR